MPAVDESPWATLNGRWTATAATGLTAFVNASPIRPKAFIGDMTDDWFPRSGQWSTSTSSSWATRRLCLRRRRKWLSSHA
jgi:hypothetical protein